MSLRWLKNKTTARPAAKSFSAAAGRVMLTRYVENSQLFLVPSVYLMYRNRLHCSKNVAQNVKQSNKE
ncbi:hypothetical protein SD77_3285 [Bacillus badius]|uniref:Uncharacterized protein n=1 Tax=Bacillus badius TaxID=1455 RepID=A0ABR5AXM3_BACBA|nr:hypothetical protein SD77_3285 [Bacillus badius]